MIRVLLSRQLICDHQYAMGKSCSRNAHQRHATHGLIQNCGSRAIRRYAGLLLGMLLSLTANAQVDPDITRCGKPPSPVPGSPYEQANGLPTYEYGFLSVPENRQQARGRCVLLRYIRFPAQPASSAEPVVVIPGGPGSQITVEGLRESPPDVRLIRHVIRSRDFIALQQRGVSDGVHATPLQINLPALPMDAQASVSAQVARYRSAVSAGLRDWQALGIDLRGYHIREMVADIAALADALGHRKIVLYGTSFGSQWAMSFIKTHPERVARAVLTGVEPIDYAWDSPDWLWNAYERIDKRARRDPAIAKALGQRTLLDIVRDQISELEKAPKKVAIIDRGSRQPMEVVVGADDLRAAVLYPSLIHFDGQRSVLEATPKFLIELDRGDYKALAAMSLRDREAQTSGFLWLLVDNTLNISAQREAKLRSEAATRWVGDVNALYAGTRDLVPGADVGDEFRADFDLEMPVLMVQGDVDLSTPMENAQSQIPRLKRGRLLIVEGGTHSVLDELLTPELLPADSDADQRLLEFMAPSSSNTASPETILRGLPERIALKPFEFANPQGETFYQTWLKEKDAE